MFNQGRQAGKGQQEHMKRVAWLVKDAPLGMANHGDVEAMAMHSYPGPAFAESMKREARAFYRNAPECPLL